MAMGTQERHSCRKARTRCDTMLTLVDTAATKRMKDTHIIIYLCSAQVLSSKVKQVNKIIFGFVAKRKSASNKLTNNNVRCSFSAVSECHSLKTLFRRRKTATFAVNKACIV